MVYHEGLYIALTGLFSIGMFLATLYWATDGKRKEGSTLLLLVWILQAITQYVYYYSGVTIHDCNGSESKELVYTITEAEATEYLKLKELCR